MSLILAPFDFSANAVRALDQALILSVQSGSSLEVLHITNEKLAGHYPKEWGAHPSVEAIENQLRNKVEERQQATGKFPSSVKYTVKESVLISGGIIGHTLDIKADLLVMGTHGWTGFADNWLGSNTSSLINHALFPILAVPPDWAPVPLEKGIVNLKLKDLPARLPDLEKWAGFLHTPLEVIEFTVTVGTASVPPGVALAPDSLIKIYGEMEQIAGLSLAKNIAQYASAQEKNTFCVSFVHPRTWFEKIFQGSVTEKISGIIEVPLLALPLK